MNQMAEKYPLQWPAGCSAKEVEPCRYLYEMPSGAVCKSWYTSNPMKFDKCDDGRVYVNPETYREIKGRGCQ